MKEIETLKLNYNFRNVFLKGEFFPENQVIVYILKNKYEKNRVGYAIGRKISKAVKRNRIKRVFRAAFYEIYDKLLPGYDIVFVWNKKNSIEELNFHIVKESMYKAFRKAEILDEMDNK